MARARDPGAVCVGTCAREQVTSREVLEEENPAGFRWPGEIEVKLLEEGALVTACQEPRKRSLLNPGPKRRDGSVSIDRDFQIEQEREHRHRRSAGELREELRPEAPSARLVERPDQKDRGHDRRREETDPEVDRAVRAGVAGRDAGEQPG